MPSASGIAILGGTFDPIHFGHLRSAVEVREALQVDCIKFIPSHIPPHRDAPRSTAEQRVKMLKLAIDGVEGLEIDGRELAREGKSYAVDTLRSIREEVGSELSVTTVIGFDSYRLLNEWREWRALLDYAHIAVLERPGYSEHDLSDEVADFSTGRFVDDPACLRSRPHGLMCKLRLIQIDISATAIRNVIAAGKSPAFMLPREVISYIYENGLYGATL